MASKILLAIAGLIALGVIALLLTMASGNETAILIGGWGLIFLGVPLIAIFLICVFFGLALRLLRRSPDSSDQVSDESKGKFLTLLKKALGLFAAAVGVLVLAYLVITVISWTTA